MSTKHSMIAISVAAFLLSSPAIVKAQAPVDTPPDQSDGYPGC